jgi:hypothetical protein
VSEERAIDKLKSLIQGSGVRFPTLADTAIEDINNTYNDWRCIGVIGICWQRRRVIIEWTSMYRPTAVKGKGAEGSGPEKEKWAPNKSGNNGTCYWPLLNAFRKRL